MRNIRLTLSYDGTRYLGWQWQPYGPTIQGALQDAVQKLTGETAEVIGSGRTDAGVHAIGQVANFVTSSQLPRERFLRGLNHFLPKDIILREVDEAPLAFHAQFQAKKKRYRYVLSDRPIELPFLRPYVWFVRSPLNADAMHEAGQILVGTHDFRCFETKWPNKATSVRTVSHLSLRRHAGWNLWAPEPQHVVGANGSAATANAQLPFISLEIEADGFLYNMVRAITGTLVNVGRGTWTAEDVRRVLVEQDRSRAGGTAPACGLYMACVHYASGDARTHD